MLHCVIINLEEKVINLAKLIEIVSSKDRAEEFLTFTE